MNEQTRLIVRKDSNDYKFILYITGVSILAGALAFSLIYALLK